MSNARNQFKTIRYATAMTLKTCALQAANGACSLIDRALGSTRVDPPDGKPEPVRSRNHPPSAPIRDSVSTDTRDEFGCSGPESIDG